MSEHTFGEGVITRCKYCRALKSRKGKGHIYSLPDGKEWTETPSPCPMSGGIMRLDSIVLERGGQPASVDAYLEPESEEEPWSVTGDWRAREIAFFDLETTGLDGRVHVPTEVGFVRGRILETGGVEVLDRYCSLCFVPPHLADGARETAAITGITYESLADAPSFKQVAEEVHAFLEKCAPDTILASYNTHFDVPFFGFAHVRVGVEMHPILLREEVLDPMLWSRKINRYITGGHKLVTVAQRVGVVRGAEDLANAHRADFDAEIGLRVLAALARNQQVPKQLDELWLWQRASHGAWADNYFNYRLRTLRKERGAML